MFCANSPHGPRRRFDTGVCYTWYDERLDCTEVVLVGLPHGKDPAEELVSTIEGYRALALKLDTDPFVAQTRQVDSPGSPVLEKIQLDRNKLHVVKSLGAGSLGTIYLANRSVPQSEASAPGHVWNRVRDSVITHDVDVLCAVKVIPRQTRREQLKRFMATCELEATLDHPNIVKLFGVALRQMPYLKISEFMRYGDLKRLLQACTLKKVTLRPSEQYFVMAQLAEGLVYVLNPPVRFSPPSLTPTLAGTSTASGWCTPASRPRLSLFTKAAKSS